MNKFQMLMVAAGLGVFGGLTIGLIIMGIFSIVFGPPSHYLIAGSAGAGGAIAHFLGNSK